MFVKGKGKKRKDDFDEYHDEDSIDSNEADGVPDAAKTDIEKHDETAIEDEFGAKDYRSQMTLKPDSTSRPLWVVRVHIYLFYLYNKKKETFPENFLSLIMKNISKRNIFIYMFMLIISALSIVLYIFIGTKWAYISRIFFSCI